MGAEAERPLHPIEGTRLVDGASMPHFQHKYQEAVLRNLPNPSEVPHTKAIVRGSNQPPQAPLRVVLQTFDRVQDPPGYRSIFASCRGADSDQRTE